MRKLREEELQSAAIFIVEQFWDKEVMQLMYQGFEEEAAKKLAVEIEYQQLQTYLKNGDIFIYDNAISGAIVGIASRKLFSPSFLLQYFMRSRKVLAGLSKKEKAVLKRNLYAVNEAHRLRWFKKYCRNPYYIAQFGIDKQKRGQGIAREMLEFIFEQHKNEAIILETNSKTNMPIYEHLGFDLVETHENPSHTLAEYCFVKHVEQKEGGKNDRNIL